jgi:hypothetical protein
VVVGINPSATNNFDSTYDVVSPPYPPAGVHSYIYHSTYQTSPVDLRYLSQSILPNSDDTWEWTIKIIRIDASDTVTLSWDALSLPVNVIELSDESGQLSNMKLLSQYTFSAEAGVLYTFFVTASNNPDATPQPTPTPTSTPISPPGGEGVIPVIPSDPTSSPTSSSEIPVTPIDFTLTPINILIVVVTSLFSIFVILILYRKRKL